MDSRFNGSPRLLGLFVTLIRRFSRAMRTRVRWQLVGDEIDSKAKPVAWPARVACEFITRTLRRACASSSSSLYFASRWTKITVTPPPRLLLPRGHVVSFFFRFLLLSPFFTLLSLLSSYHPSFPLLFSLRRASFSFVFQFDSTFLSLSSFFPSFFFFCFNSFHGWKQRESRPPRPSFATIRPALGNQMTQRERSTGMIAFNGGLRGDRCVDRIGINGRENATESIFENITRRARGEDF